MRIFIFFFGYVTIFLPNIFAQKNISDTQINEALSSIIDDYSLDRNDISTYKVKDLYTRDKSGITHIYLNQTANGYSIFNAQIQLHFNSNNELVFHNSRFIQNKAEKLNSESISIDINQAFSKALDRVDTASIVEDLVVDFKSAADNTFFLEDSKNFLYPVRTEIGYEKVGEDLILVYKFVIEFKAPVGMYNVKVDANTGDVIDVKSLIVSCQFDHDHSNDCNNESLHDFNKYTVADDNITPKSDGAVYNAYPLGVESPIHGDRALITNAPYENASPYGWHDVTGDFSSDYTITRGNNVYAYEDTDNTNSPGYSPDAGGALEFDYPYDMNGDPYDNMDASITNLFVWNNYLHDLSYFYGFDEVSGNFQQNNFEKGGAEYDFVVAEGLDGGGTNNANFYTPPDGYNPRMQMYLWYQMTGELFTVNSPAEISGAYEIGTASFGPPVPETPITADIVLVHSNDDQPTEGCSPLQNAADINGKIAVADRGSCFFYEKALNAQDAGAIALIIINNEAGGAINMAGDDGGAVNIPVVSLSLADGNIIKDKMLSETVNVSIGGTIQQEVFDSGFDNGVIAHEYGHGISNRLTGGPSESGCLWNEEQMGEGWSDFYALVSSDLPGSNANEGRGIGNFVSGKSTTGSGIRPFPYSRDMSVNPLTYANINQLSIPHGVGSVWCTMLWDLYWDLVDVYGNNYDVYGEDGGNNIANFLVMEGMRIQSCDPGFIDGRDAILAADQYLYDGANQCLIWKAFARRGLGYSASQGSSYSVGDEQEAFDLPPSCTETVLTPDFIADKTEMCENSVVSFESDMDSSSFDFLWTFEGGTPATSTEATPDVFYASSGRFNVSLSVSDDEGSGQTTKSNYITVSNGPSFDVEVIDKTDDTDNGSAKIVNIQGFSPYSFTWDEFPLNDADNVSNLSEGTYTVRVSDDFKCSSKKEFNIKSLVGINEHSDINFNIYPNPAHDKLTIDNDSGVVIRSAKIINPVGKIIHVEHIGSANPTISLSGLSKGVYFLEINTDDISKRVRFVKF